MSVLALGRRSSRETRQNLCTRNGDADIENGPGHTAGKGEGGASSESRIDIYTPIVVESLSRLQLLVTP